MEKSNKNSGIQALRAFACLAVLLQHTIYYVCVSHHIDYHPYLPINIGRFGVHLFFVISGFVITLCLYQGKQFIFKRLLRIFPPFWLAILLSSMILPALNYPWQFTWDSLFFLSLNNSYAVPYWSLVYEMVFYFLVYGFILLRLSSAMIIKIMLVWLLMIFICDSVHPVLSTSIPGKWILLSPLNIFFIFGVFLALDKQKLCTKIPLSFLLAATLFFWLVSLMLPFEHSLFALTAALGYVSLVSAARRISFDNRLVRLGDMSYGLYLIHPIIILSVLALLNKAFPALSGSYLGLIAFFFALSLGAAYGYLENWLHEKKWYIARFTTSKISTE